MKTAVGIVVALFVAGCATHNLGEIYDASQHAVLTDGASVAIIYVDADVDGNSIAGLLLNFFYKYWPDMFDRRMVYKVETPIVVAVPKAKTKKKVLFYSQTEYNDWASKNDLKNYEIKYKKGLAALVDDEYQDIINSPRMTLITKDELSEGSLDIWFGKNSDLRKTELLK